MAEEPRVPVSNLVRNVLEAAFSVVERVSDDMGDLVDDVIDQAERASDQLREYRDRRRRREERLRRHMEARERARRGPDADDSGPAAEAEAEGPAEDVPEPQPSLAEAFPEVIAWQLVVLNQARRCALSGVELPAGTEAYVGLGAQGLTDAVLSAEVFEAEGERAR